MNFKTISLSFLTALILTCFLCYSLEVSWWWLLAPLIVYKIWIIYGSATIQSGFFVKTNCSGETSKKEIAITFDDGPDAEFTPEILKLLAENIAPATFFVIGNKIKGNENVLRQMNASGHLIGNHTFSHSFFIDFKSTGGFMEELNATSDTVYNIIGKRMQFFRPPYGVTTPNLTKAALKLNYKVIGWNIRSLDTTGESETKIVNRVTKQIKPGAVILLHDVSLKTVNVLKLILNFTKEQGYTIVGLDRLLDIEAYE